MLPNLSTEREQETKLKLGFLVSLLVLSMVFTGTAFAGADTTFSAFVTQLTSWIEGSLGLGISIASVIIGVVAGLMQGSVKAFGIGIGIAVGLNYTPAILSSMFTATIL